MAGYATASWMAQNDQLRQRVKLSIQKLAESQLDATQPDRKKMARALLRGNQHQILEDLAIAVCIDDVNLESTDIEIDQAIVANVRLLLVKTGAEE